MCCLYGVYCYGEALNKNDMQSIIKHLGYAATERGTDATGIAYAHKNKICVKKAGVSAYKFKFDLPDNVRVVTGHTRLTTQGNEKFNYNNHPFIGNCGRTAFALAHNGVIHNDTDLRQSLKLPKSKIETDSYVVTQMLEKEANLNIGAIKSVVEQLEGSFCFSILDNRDNLFLTKGSNPLYIIHHKKLKSYFYASTSEVLWSGIIASSLFEQYFKPYLTKAKDSPIEEIVVDEGDIIQISHEGEISHGTFEVKPSYFGFGRYYHPSFFCDTAYDDFDYYITMLEDFAARVGMERDIVGILIKEGFSFDEIEDFIFGDNGLLLPYMG